MPAKPIDNERRACDAVVRVLEERHGAVRANGRSPEDERVGPPIEYVFDLGERTYALEHTVVEAFDGQIRKELDFAAFVAPIAAALDHQMPRPGSYRLTFAIHPSKGLKPKRIAEAQAAIVAWVRAAAAEMHAERPDVPMRGRRPYGHESNRRGTTSTYTGKSVGRCRKPPTAASSAAALHRPTIRRSESNGCAPHWQRSCAS
jgi:hypothetical protein